jgi:hypothetical protein
MSYIIVDIDGTIALRGERDPYCWEDVINDEQNKPIIGLVMQLEQFNDLIFVSGRKDICRNDTIVWLELCGFDDFELHMRRADDNRPDEIVKKEIYEKHIYPRKVRWVFDDRNKVVKMWRELGLTCLQVADGDF